MNNAPQPGWFTYVAWTLTSARLGPFVVPNARRRQAVHILGSVVHEVEQVAGVDQVRVLEATFIPPLRGGPRYDLVVLARGNAPVTDNLLACSRAAGMPDPSFVATARNVVRFGDTEEPAGNILLNHFLGTTDASSAVDAWTSAARWYSDELHVDNSTLLQFEQPAEFLIMNYARIPGAVLPFMAQQLLRPSFYRQVQAVLRRTGVRPFPIFLKSAGS